MLNAIGFVALVAALLVLFYYIAQKTLPTWGTVLMNTIPSLGLLVDQANALPWGTIMSIEHAAKVGFGLAVANIIVRLNGPKPPVGQPNA